MTSPAAAHLRASINDQWEAQTVIAHLQGTTDRLELADLARAERTVAAFATLMTREDVVTAVANLLDAIAAARAVIDDPAPATATPALRAARVSNSMTAILARFDALEAAITTRTDTAT